MGFENLDLDDNLEETEETAPVEESSNRTFLIIAAALGGVALLAVICIVIYIVWLLPRMRSGQVAQKATLEAQQTEVGLIIASTSTSAAETAIVASYTETPTVTPIPPTQTPTSSPTPVVAVPTTPQGAAGLPSATVGPQMATATALHSTLQANATLYASTLTARPSVQPTGIPNTGFADDVGLPAMLGMAVLLIAIIFLARRLRSA
jgi:hypothetical protein